MSVPKKSSTDDIEFQMRFYEELLLRRPDYPEALILLGEIYTRRGNFKKGLEVDRRLSRLKPENPIVHYNLACSLSLVGEVSESLQAIRQAIRLGYDDLQYLTRDPDLTNVRQDARFNELVKELRKTTAPKNARKRSR
jgi:tetratricopeptide (TPR) repeat protein